MKIIKGFEALEYVLKNKDVILYNRKGQTLRFDKEYNRLSIEPRTSYCDHIIINDKTIQTEWYTENKKKVLLKIYVDNKLQEVQDHYFFDIRDNLEMLLEGIKVSYKQRTNCDGIVAVKYELYK